MQEVLPPETIVIRKDSPAAWAFRAVLFLAVAVIGGLGYRISESMLTRLDGLFGVVAKVDQLTKDQADLKKSVDGLAAASAGYAKADDVTQLRSDLDKVDGRVQALENIYSPPEVPARRPK